MFYRRRCHCQPPQKVFDTTNDQEPAEFHYEGYGPIHGSCNKARNGELDLYAVQQREQVYAIASTRVQVHSDRRASEGRRAGSRERAKRVSEERGVGTLVPRAPAPVQSHTRAIAHPIAHPCNRTPMQSHSHSCNRILIRRAPPPPQIHGKPPGGIWHLWAPGRYTMGSMPCEEPYCDPSKAERDITLGTAILYLLQVRRLETCSKCSCSKRS
jgi:hypothetical protein